MSEYTARNLMNLMAGSGMQQAHDAVVEEAVKVVGNHEDGTRPGCGNPGTKRTRKRTWEWTQRAQVGGEAKKP